MLEYLFQTQSELKQKMDLKYILE
nr:unnamed protein product [Callosobruchus analis]